MSMNCRSVSLREYHPSSSQCFNYDSLPLGTAHLSRFGYPVWDTSVFFFGFLLLLLLPPIKLILVILSIIKLVSIIELVLLVCTFADTEACD